MINRAQGSQLIPVRGQSSPLRYSRRQRSRQGQTIVVALLVLLLLAFASALFVAIVARNLINVARTARVQTADFYAQAGITFADNQLLNSTMGADWRPVPQAAAATTADPDYDYLNQGFVRFNAQGGRYLLKLTYQPLGVTGTEASDPLGHYIKVESVGREGVVNPLDPTTFHLQNHLSSSLIAYVPIGITDYARFETNIDKRSDIMNLGPPSIYDTTLATPAVVTPGVFDFTGGATPALQQYAIAATYGAPDAYQIVQNAAGATIAIPNPDAGQNNPIAGQTYQPGGGSIFANGSLRFFGINAVYLNAATGTLAASTTYLHEGVSVAGNILLDGFGSTGYALNQQQADLLINPHTPATAPTATQQNDYVHPSIAGPSGIGGDPFIFDTHNQSVRDGSVNNDAVGNPRNIHRLDPPVIDAVNTATGLSRYVNLAVNSAPNALWTGPATQSAGQAGYGQVLYCDNTTDIQPESQNMVGGYTLVDDWLNRTSANGSAYQPKGGWIGNLYLPPGVEVILGPLEHGPEAGEWGVTLIRHDTRIDPATNLPVAVNWENPDGSAGSSPELDISYTDLGANNPITGTPARTGVGISSNYNNDVVIVVAGNARIRGVASKESGDPVGRTGPGSAGNPNANDTAPHHVTIVSLATAYIDGSLLKGNPNSSISVLARDYVCLNTTLFQAGADVSQLPGGASPPEVVTGDQNAVAFPDDTHFLAQEFTFGLPVTFASGSAVSQTPFGFYGGTNKLYLYLSASPEAGTTSVLDFAFLDTNTNQFASGPAKFAPPDGTVASGSQSVSQALKTTLAIGPDAGTSGGGGTAIENLAPSDPLQLWIYRDPAAQGALDLQRAAILPNDVRIEAVLYAQNKSFFVIPGPWFNDNPQDNLSAFVGAPGTNRVGLDQTDAQDRYPFYGQPIDLKITIYGAVSEARPADISAQTAWMQKWGWIPQYHGSLVPGGAVGPSETAGHYSPPGPASGLTFVYDPQCGYPGAFDTALKHFNYNRVDPLGNPLPFTPDLPVCQGLVYSGQEPQLPVN